MTQRITLQAPAKLNLTLDITGLAPNGYHTLDMVMHTVSLCDTVTVEPADEIKLVCPDWLPNGPKNLAWRAAELLREHAGVGRGALISLDKRIPAQAGMGGGSADAAAVLKGMNELWGLGLTVGELCKIGLALGSDVPFAVAGGTARVSGVGEEIEPIVGIKPLWFLLAKPDGGVDTAEAYRLYDEIGAVTRPHNKRFLEALQCGDFGGMAQYGGNALEKAAMELLPAIGELLAMIRKTSAPYAAMTGSGAAVFAVFETEGEAQAACAQLHGAAWKAVARSLDVM